MKPVDFSLPISVGVQPLETLYFQLDTKLLQVGISQSENAFFIKDATPLSLTAVWNALPPLDLQAVIGTDLTNTPGDSFTFLIGARYYAGQL